MVTLDIFADPICPWCYIGKIWMERALEQAGTSPFVIRWHPFQLNPEMPSGGMERRAYLEAKFGGTEGALKAYGPVVEAAEGTGIPLALDKITYTPNTVNAHRLIRWAELEERQSFVVQRLMEAYFREGRDIGATEVLADIADSAGMDAAMVHRLLASDAELNWVAQQDSGARQMGISSVPTYVVAGTHAVPGAQRPDLWLSVIEDIRTAEAQR